MKCLKILSGLVALLLIVVTTTHGQITVSPDGPVTSIQEAIERSEPGGTIEVMPGTYEENNIEITKPLTITGIGIPVIDGQNEGTILVIRADSVTVQGFEIRNTGRSYVRDYAAVLIDQARDFRVEENRLDNVFFGIYLAETERGIVKNNSIQAYDRREASSGNGIHLWNVKNPEIIGNSVEGMRDGIYLEFVENAKIHGNISQNNNRYGLHYMFSNGGTYYDNVFRKNGAGVAVMYSEDVDMKNNLFEHNWGTSSYGLLLKDMRHSTIEGNRFYRNTVAIYSESSSNLKIHRNDIELNGWAVNIKSSSTRNIFTENNFIENSFDVRTDSPRNNNVFEGNYWSHYEGYDLDRDGIGDVPYRPVSLFSIIIDRQPESLILMRSMFIRLLDMAERIMPVLTPQTLFDEQPKMQRIQ
jgi:nitrous oxidase accessory protein